MHGPGNAPSLLVAILSFIAVSSVVLQHGSAADHATPVLPVGHTGRVQHFQVSSDESSLVSTDGNRIIVWDVTSGRQLQAIQPERAAQLHHVAISADGSMIAATTLKQHALVWRTSTGNQFAKIETEFPIRDASFFANGTRLVLAGNRSAEVWDSLGQRRISTLRFPDSMRQLAVASDAEVMAVAAGKGLLLFDLNSSQLTARHELAWTATSVSISGSGRYVCISGSRNAVIWDADQNSVLNTLRGQNSVLASAIRDDLRVLTVTGKASRIRDAATGKPIQNLRRGSWVRAASFTKNMIALAGDDGSIDLLSSNGELRRTLSVPLALAGPIDIHRDSRRALIVRSDQEASVWSLSTNQIERRLQGVTRNAAKLSPDGRRAAVTAAMSSGSKRGVSVFDLASGGALTHFSTQASRISWSPDGRQLLTGSLSLSNRAQLWDVESGRLLHEFQGQKYLNDSDANPMFVDNRNIAIAGADRAELWARQSNRHVKSLNAKGQFIGSAAVSPDSALLACAGTKLGIYDLETGERELSESGNAITAIGFNPDGTSILTGHRNGEITEWNSAARKQRVIGKTAVSVGSIAFSSQDRLWSTHSDGVIRIWDLKAGRLLARVVFLKRSDDWLAVTPDGRLDGTPAGLAIVDWRTDQALLETQEKLRHTSRATHPGLLSSLSSNANP